jgi:SAM-dependent methyltransferase
MYLYLREETKIFTEHIRLLHFAPEPWFARIFSERPTIDYFPVDIDTSNPLIREAIDIQDIPYPDGYFDVIYCSHVLEHVPDDRRAMGERYRVLKSGGWAVLQVPINARSETTIEDPDINTRELRSRFYGQHDHLRYYGLDYAERRKDAGFTVNIDPILQ